jgi:L-ribulose-5-phosphate 3-epimerase
MDKMEVIMNRRKFIGITGVVVGGICLSGCESMNNMIWGDKMPFKISLAQWSLNNRLFGRVQPTLDNLDFAQEAKRLGFEAVEYVNQFFMDKATDRDYINEMKKRAADNGVKSLLIMCDNEGRLGDPDEGERIKTVENHYKWADAAKQLGCHSIRVNAASTGPYDEQQKFAADGLSRLCEYGAKLGLNVIVENHGGFSSNAEWLVGVMEMVDMPNCGTLPDFGNFDRGPEGYRVDIYESVGKLMPYAVSVSAKSYDFDENGDETLIDYYRMVNVVLNSGYKGYINVEYEGRRLSEEEGIIATRKLLEKIREQRMSA